MKKSLLLLIIFCIFLGTSGQEKNQADVYSGDLIYILPDSESEDQDLKQVKLVLQLDKLAFESVSKIIVEQEGLDEPGNLIGKSYHFNFEDMVIGWDAALRRRYTDQDEMVLINLIREVEKNDKVRLDHENFLVEIDLGFIRADNTTQVINVNLKYKDQTLSDPLILAEQVKFR